MLDMLKNFDAKRMDMDELVEMSAYARIFANEVRLSGRVPQICCLFGPSAAGSAYIPAFCDAVFMVEGNASMYLGSPRMAEVVIGEHVSLEEMGGARMHAKLVDHAHRSRRHRRPFRRRIRTCPRAGDPTPPRWRCARDHAFHEPRRAGPATIAATPA